MMATHGEILMRSLYGKGRKGETKINFQVTEGGGGGININKRRAGRYGRRGSEWSAGVSSLTLTQTHTHAHKGGPDRKGLGPHRRTGSLAS